MIALLPSHFLLQLPVISTDVGGISEVLKDSASVSLFRFEMHNLWRKQSFNVFLFLQTKKTHSRYAESFSWGELKECIGNS